METEPKKDDAKPPFRPDTTRVIKPRSLEEVDAIKEKEL